MYIDGGAGMTRVGGVAAWTFETGHWGECGQGDSEFDALANLARRVGTADFHVAERIGTGEARQVFDTDLVPATEEQVTATASILRAERARTIALVESASPAALRMPGADVPQPTWMRWRTAEAIAWHVADTESRHYLGLLGLGSREPLGSLRAELAESAAWVQERLRTMPRDARAEVSGEVWTSVKVLRRLAWHERVESVFLRRRVRAASG